MTDRNDRWHRVSQKAFELYESRGGTPGRHVEDWLEAERLVDLEAEAIVTESKEEEVRIDSAAQHAAADRADAGVTTPKKRGRASTAPRGARKRSKSATL